MYYHINNHHPLPYSSIIILLYLVLVAVTGRTSSAHCSTIENNCTPTNILFSPYRTKFIARRLVVAAFQPIPPLPLDFRHRALVTKIPTTTKNPRFHPFVRTMQPPIMKVDKSPLPHSVLSEPDIISSSSSSSSSSKCTSHTTTLPKTVTPSPTFQLRRSSRKRTRVILFSSSSSQNSPTIKNPLNDYDDDDDDNVAEDTDFTTTLQHQTARRLTYPKKIDINNTPPTKKQQQQQQQQHQSSSSTKPPLIASDDLSSIAPQNQWIDLKTPPSSLRPSATLTTGQCFNWIPLLTTTTTNNNNNDSPSSAWGTHDAKEWIGPLSHRILHIRETSQTTLVRILHPPNNNSSSSSSSSTSRLISDLRDYFQLHISLEPLYAEWCHNNDDDVRLRHIAKCIPGVRVLRQDPLECLFSFVCSSNNNIPRITMILRRLREAYGTMLLSVPTRGEEREEEGGMVTLHQFPTLEELRYVTEDELRQMGWGYRAKYVVKTIELLDEFGGEEWLDNLRRRRRRRHHRDDDNNNNKTNDKTNDDVRSELTKLSGIGRKVADCISLFSLDRTDVVPVDVHVLTMATRDYDKDGVLSSLREVKSLTPALYETVGDLFRERFGEYAGWAHSLLFVAELPSFRGVLPEDVVRGMDEWREKEMARKAAAKRAKSPKKKKKTTKIL